MKLVLLLPTLLASVGCASQKSIDDLSKQLADINTRLTKLEMKQTEVAEQKSVAKADLQHAVDRANERRLNCRARAEEAFNSVLKENGTPVEGKKGTYNVDLGIAKHARENQERANADCQKQYEDDLQTAKLKYSE